MAKIAILIPHNHPSFDPNFTLSLISLIQSFYVWVNKAGLKHELAVFHQRDGWVDRMRNVLGEQALKAEMDYLFWLDADMTFPPTLIQESVEFFEEHSEIDAITGLYTWKQPPFLPHVYPSYDEKDDKFTVAAVFSVDEAFEVAGAGFGCLAMRSEVLKRLPPPWFEFKYGVFGEDLWFFRRFIKEGKGVKMVCNPNFKCFHLSQTYVGLEHYLKFNNLPVKDGMILMTPDIMQKIQAFQEKLTQKFENGKR